LAFIATFAKNYIGMPQKKLYTLTQALEYAKDYCAKEEHCQSDVKKKLRSYGVLEEEADICLAELITEGFINEQRYADLFAVSKFHQNKWGRNKITMHLKAKEISSICIGKALDKIDMEEYFDMINRLFEKRMPNGKSEANSLERKKTISFLIGRGFEYSEITKALDVSDDDF